MPESNGEGVDITALMEQMGLDFSKCILLLVTLTSEVVNPGPSC